MKVAHLQAGAAQRESQCLPIRPRLASHIPRLRRLYHRRKVRTQMCDRSNVAATTNEKNLYLGWFDHKLDDNGRQTAGDSVAEVSLSKSPGGFCTSIRVVANTSRVKTGQIANVCVQRATNKPSPRVTGVKGLTGKPIPGQ